jgi:hypothetical protein
MDVYDTKKITKHFKYDGDFTELENFVRGAREQIDKMELTEDDKQFFDAIKRKYVTKK